MRGLARLAALAVACGLGRPGWHADAGALSVAGGVGDGLVAAVSRFWGLYNASWGNSSHAARGAAGSPGESSGAPGLLRSWVDAESIRDIFPDFFLQPTLDLADLAEFCPEKGLYVSEALLVAGTSDSVEREVWKHRQDLQAASVQQRDLWGLCEISDDSTLAPIMSALIRGNASWSGYSETDGSIPASTAAEMYTAWVERIAEVGLDTEVPVESDVEVSAAVSWVFSGSQFDLKSETQATYFVAQGRAVWVLLPPGHGLPYAARHDFQGWVHRQASLPEEARHVRILLQGAGDVLVVSENWRHWSVALEDTVLIAVKEDAGRSELQKLREPLLPLLRNPQEAFQVSGLDRNASVDALRALAAAEKKQFARNSSFLADTLATLGCLLTDPPRVAGDSDAPLDVARVDESIELLSQAIRLDPTHLDAVYCLAEGMQSHPPSDSIVPNLLVMEEKLRVAATRALPSIRRVLLLGARAKLLLQLSEEIVEAKDVSARIADGRMRRYRINAFRFARDAMHLAMKLPSATQVLKAQTHILAARATLQLHDGDVATLRSVQRRRRLANAYICAVAVRTLAADSASAHAVATVAVAADGAQTSVATPEKTPLQSIRANLDLEGLKCLNSV